MQNFNNFKEFYEFYLEEHKNPKTKLLHFLGTSAALLGFYLALAVHIIFLFASLFLGYGLAWFSHFYIEKNRPATFKYPLRSFLADFVMFSEVIRGKHKIF